MKKRVSFVLSTAVLGFLGATQPASAANLTWDPSHTGTASDGSGNWNTTDANWWNGSADVAVTPLAQSNGVASGATVTGSPVISLLSTAGMTVGQYFGGTNVPIGSTILSIDTGLNKVTISANATGNANNQLFQAADKLTIGAGTGAGGTITLTAPAGVNTLTFAANSGNYIINESGTAALTLTAGPNAPTNLTIASGTNVTFNNEVSLTNPNQAGTINVADGQTLTFAKAGNALSSTLVGGANSTVKVTGNTGAGNLGIVNLGSGSAETGGLQISGAATLGGGWQIGTLAGNAYALLSTGGTANINGTGQLTIGRNGAVNSGKLRVDGGTLNITSTATAPAFIGRSSGNGTLKVTAGTVNAIAATSQIQVASDTNSIGLLDISGGTVNASQISFHGANDATSGSAAGTGSSVVSLSGTGSLYVGGFGANTKGFDNRQTDIGTVGIKAVVNLSGGTLGAIANWTSDANTNFALVSGNSTIKAASAADVPHDISIAGVVSGSGALTKTGGGMLTLSNSANTLLGNISVVGGTLSLSNNNTIGDGSNISILTGGVFDLNFVGTDTVNTLSLDNTFQAVGLWGAQGNPGATFTSPLLSGTGLLNVTAVPEPRIWVMLGAGLALVMVLRRRTRVS